MSFYYGRFEIGIHNIFLQRLVISLIFVGIVHSPNDIVAALLSVFLHGYYSISCFLGFMAIIAILPRQFNRLSDKSKQSILHSFGTWLKLREDRWSLFNIFDTVTYACIIAWSLLMQFYALTFILILSRGVFESIFIWQSERFNSDVYQPILAEYYKRQVHITQRYMEHIFKHAEKVDSETKDADSDGD